MENREVFYLRRLTAKYEFAVFPAVGAAKDTGKVIKLRRGHVCEGLPGARQVPPGVNESYLRE